MNIGGHSRPFSLKVAVENVVGDDRPLAVVLRLATASGPRPQGIAPHQPFDPVKAAGQAFFKNIAPHAAGAIGPVAGLETRLDCRDELGVLDLAGAGRAIEPSMETRPRNLQNLA